MLQVEPPGLHVVHVAVEMAPICKVGGLGDVVTALGRAVQEEGHMVEVILPRWPLPQPAQSLMRVSKPCPAQSGCMPMGRRSMICQHKERLMATVQRL